MTSGDDDDTSADRILSSVLRPRLAADADTDTPTVEELGLENAKNVAVSWQKHRSIGRIYESKWRIKGNPGPEVVQEIRGLFGIVGELVLVSIEAEVEKELLRSSLETPELSLPMSAALERSLRVFSSLRVNVGWGVVEGP